MFKIQLSPQSGNTDTVIAVSGDILTYNEVEYDFSTITEGDVAEGEFPAIGTITRVNGDIEMTLAFDYNSSTAEPKQSAIVADYYVEVTSGLVELPIARKPGPVVPEVQELSDEGFIVPDENEVDPNV